MKKQKAKAAPKRGVVLESVVGPLKIGDAVEVSDAGLEMLRKMMAQMTGEKEKPNHYGVVSEIMSDGQIVVEFPIGDDDPNEHSQASIYPASCVRLRRPNTVLSKTGN